METRLTLRRSVTAKLIVSAVKMKGTSAITTVCLACRSRSGNSHKKVIFQNHTYTEISALTDTFTGLPDYFPSPISPSLPLPPPSSWPLHFARFFGNFGKINGWRPAINKNHEITFGHVSYLFYLRLSLSYIFVHSFVGV